MFVKTVRSKKILPWTLLYTTLLFWLSLRPIPAEVSNLFPLQDKLMHLMAYTLLGLLYLLTLKQKKYALGLSIFIGILIEILQSYTSYRSFELLDIAANTLGIFLSNFIFLQRKY